MLRKVLIPMLVFAMVFFCQCEKDELLSPSNSPSGSYDKMDGNGNGNGGGHGGNGGGHGGNGGGSSELYGDLVICLRSPDGVPIYQDIFSEEHNTTEYFVLPIKVHSLTHELLRTDDNQSYVTFGLNEEGEAIDDDPIYDVSEVDLGRMNIIRAPQKVLDKALMNVLNNLTQADVRNITTDASGRLVAIIDNEDWFVNIDDDEFNDEFNDITIDSPLENMAVYQELMSRGLNGDLSFLHGYFSERDVLVLASGALAGGADKTGNVIVDEIAYINNWILKFDEYNIPEAPESPDLLGRRYYNFHNFTYDRTETYSDKYVRIIHYNADGSYYYEVESLLNIVDWSRPDILVSYDVDNGGITGFSNATDDAIRVIEFIHSSDQIIYSPYFRR
jgi:hypothetical protein